MPEMNDWNTNIIAEFRANQGQVGGQFEGAPILLLHTIGAKTGQERVNPMMYRKVDGGYAVFASFAGQPVNPAWYPNLVANPDAVRIQDGPQPFEVSVRTSGDPAALAPVVRAAVRELDPADPLFGVGCGHLGSLGSCVLCGLATSLILIIIRIKYFRRGIA